MENLYITVVIPCYNREKMIGKAIQSVIRQTYPHWKLLIIDDASTDQSVQKIEPFLEDERIQLHPLSQNIGISMVMNTALQLIETDYFVQLDSDDWLNKSTLERFVKAIQSANPKTALFYGNIKKVKLINGKWKVIGYTRHRRFRDKYDFLQYLTEMLHPRCYRTEAVRSVGGWDTDDPFEGRVMEDRRICLKLIEEYPLYWINQFLYYRRKHKSQLTGAKSTKKRNILRKMVIENCLKKWGSLYKPIYQYNSAGLLTIKKLKKYLGKDKKKNKIKST